MNHLDQLTIELFVLGSETVAEQRDEIEAHLLECHGCKEIADEIAEFHKELILEQSKPSQEYSNNQTSLTKRRYEFTLSPETNMPVEVYRPPATVIAKIRYYITKYPIRTTIGTTTTAGILAFAMLLLFKPISEDKNPVSLRFDIENKAVVIYNQKDEKLWQYVSENVIGAKLDTYNGGSRIEIRDINGDGKNEVITTMSSLEDNNRAIPLRIFDGEKNLLLKKSFTGAFQYLSRTNYSPIFESGPILVYETPQNNECDLLVSTHSLGRSPGALFRLDSKGNELGRYWHFGNIGLIKSVDIYNDGIKEVLIGGKNDVGDTSRSEYAFIAILNPLKIVGDGKSSATPGFHCGLSDAEMFYIRFPNCDMNDSLQITNDVNSIAEVDSNTFEVCIRVNINADLGDIFQFHYIFSNSMQVIEVKSNNTTDRFHAKLKLLGKITSTIDQQYLENLKNGVRYWDGEQWRNEVTRVTSRYGITP